MEQYTSQGTTTSYTVPDDAIGVDVVVRGGVGADGGDGLSRPQVGGSPETAADHIEYPPGGTGGAGGLAIARLYDVAGESLVAEIGSDGSTGGDSPDSAGASGGPGNNNGGNGGHGGGSSRVRYDGTEVAIAGGGGGGGGGGGYNWIYTYPGVAFESGGGGGGGGGGAGGAGGTHGEAAPRTVYEAGRQWHVDGIDGTSAGGNGLGGDGGNGGNYRGQGGDGTPGGTQIADSAIAITESTSRKGAAVIFQPIYYPRGEPQTFNTPGATTYTPPENTIALDVEAIGGQGSNGRDDGANGINMDYIEFSGGTGGQGGRAVGRIPVEDSVKTFEVAVGADASNGGSSPLGNAGSGRDGGGSGGGGSGVTRTADGTQLIIAGGGGGGGAAGGYYNGGYFFNESPGGGGGGGSPGGSGGSSGGRGTYDNPDPGDDAAGSGPGGNGGNGGSWGGGGSGADGGTLLHSSVTAAKSGLIRGTSTKQPQVTVTPLFTPSKPPTNLTAIETPEHNVELSWDDRSNNESGFNIYRGDTEGSLSKIGSVTEGTETFTDTTAEAGQYYYAVTYYTDTRESFQSNTVQITIGGTVHVWTGAEWEKKPTMYFDGDEWQLSTDVTDL